MAYADEAQEVAFTLTPNGGENFRPHERGHLERGDTNSTRSAMDEDALAGLQPGKILESVVHREEGCRQGGRSGKVHALGQAGHHACVGDHMVGEGGRREGQNPVSGCEIVHSRPNFDNFAGALHAQAGPGETVLKGLVLEQSHDPH